MKWLLSVVAALIALVLIVLVVGWFAIDGIARRGIVRGTSYATGTPTQLDAANLSLADGELRLADLEIGNPEGFEAPHFMQLTEGDVAVTLGSLLSDEVEVPRLHLRGVDLNLERRDGANNYDIILENLEKLQGPPEEQPDPGKKYIIREILISDVVVKAAMFSTGDEPRVLTVEIPDIRLTDVGSDTDQGVLLSQVSGIVMQAVMQAVVEQAGDILPAAILGGLQSGLAGLGDLGDFDLEAIGDAAALISDITGGEAVEQVLEDANRAADEALRGIGDDAGEILEDTGDAARERAREGADRVREGLGGLLDGDGDEDEPADEPEDER